ncbi:MAG: (2Fe-2S)-binding protein [Actinobacteria bacterium]|nr:(2Fe-2S)-binding protein [Actinomycetota bacterium]
MAKIKYVSADGLAHVVDGDPGESVMRTAVKNGVPGIIGECGGNASCATCHVYVRPEFFETVGPPGDFEQDVLDLATTDPRDNSRLSCQIRITDDLDGLIVDLPEQQP